MVKNELCGWCEWQGVMATLGDIEVDGVPNTVAVSFLKLMVIPTFFIESWEISKGISLAMTSVARCTLWPPRITGIVAVFVAWTFWLSLKW